MKENQMKIDVEDCIGDSVDNKGKGGVENGIGNTKR